MSSVVLVLLLIVEYLQSRKIDGYRSEKNPEEEKNQKIPSTTIPTSNEDSRKSPSPNTQLVKVEVHVYIHQSPTNTTAVSTSTTDLGAGINNTLNLSLTPSEQEALLE